MKKICLTILFYLFLVTHSFSQQPQAKIPSIFREAGATYQAGDYQEAVELYESILEGGYESGAIYYNLANSYFKVNRIGKAILNYERALLLMPRDSDVKFNYQYALTQAKIPSKQHKLNFLQKAIEGHRTFYTREEMVKIIMAAFIFWGILFLISLYFKWTPQVRLGLSLVFIFIISVYVTGFTLKVQHEQNFAIMILPADAKFEPRPEATNHFTLLEGSQVHILKSQNGWLKIKRLDGKLGWVKDNSAERVEK